MGFLAFMICLPSDLAPLKLIDVSLSNLSFQVLVILFVRIFIYKQDCYCSGVFSTHSSRVNTTRLSASHNILELPIEVLTVTGIMKALSILPLPVTGTALEKEQARVKQMLDAKTKRRYRGPKASGPNS